MGQPLPGMRVITATYMVVGMVSLVVLTAWMVSPEFRNRVDETTRELSYRWLMWQWKQRHKEPPEWVTDMMKAKDLPDEA